MKKLLLFLTIIPFISSCNKMADPATNPLKIPELIDSASEETINLVLQKSQHEFYSGIKSNTMGINSTYLGPTIKLHKGKTAKIQFVNAIEQKHNNTWSWLTC